MLIPAALTINAALAVFILFTRIALARYLYLTPRKIYLRKHVEALIAVEMDLLPSKNRILALHLNNTEWWRGVYGIGAAALRSSVDTFTRGRQMVARYRYLVSQFADPSDA